MSIALDRPITRSTVRSALEELDFVRVRGGDGFRRDGLKVTPEGRWLQVATPPVARATVLGAAHRGPVTAGALLRAQMGRPGPWRLVIRGNRIVRECELPSSIADPILRDVDIDLDDTDATTHGTPHSGWTVAQFDQRSIGPDMWRRAIPTGSSTTTVAHPFSEVAGPLAASLSWLEAASEERLPRGWYPPPRDDLESWLRPGDLVVRRETLTVRGELVAEPGRLALVFPLIERIPDELPDMRLRWLDALIADAQARWRLVRLGFVAGPEQVTGEVADAMPAGSVGGAAHGDSVLVEVDLSGLPTTLAETMLRSAVDSLRCVVDWLLAPAAVIADPGIESRVLEMDPREL